MNRLSTLSFALLVALGAGCATETKQRERINSEAEFAISTASQAWEVVHAGRVVGVLVEFEENGGGRTFFSVRNREQQELGMVDELGRSWRYRPHAPEPEWLGTGTVMDGVQRILELGDDAELFEVRLELLRAN